MGINVGGVASLTSPSGATLSLDGAAPWMKVDGNGILTRQQIPYMRGQLTGKGSPYNGGGGSLLVTADTNIGNCWNNATGYFTCPVAGHYMATVGNIAGPAYGYVYIQKNGASFSYTHWYHASSWHYVSLSSIVNCAAGDTIRWTLGTLSPTTNGFYGDGGHGMYSIALMA